MNSIRSRILLPLALFMVLMPLCTYVSFGVVTGRYMKDLAYSDLANSLNSARAVVENVYGRYDADTSNMSDAERRERAKEIMMQTRTALRRSQFESMIIVLNRSYSMLFPSEPDEEASAIAAYFSADKDAQPLDTAHPDFEEFDVGGKTYIACLMRLTDPDQMLSNYLIVYNSISDTGSLLSTAAWFALIITGVMSLVALVVAWLAATSIAYPIGRLCSYVSSIGEGRFYPTDQVSRVREVQSLITATNRMANRLDRYDKAQKTFFQNASHELRTPLMSIQGYAEGISYGVWADPTEAAGIIAAESRRLTELVDELLTLSRLDNDQQAIDIEEIDLAAFLNNTLERLKGMAMQKNVALSVASGDGPCPVWADEQLLNKSILNVLSNAVRYASSQVTARIERDEGQVRLYIADDGPGIAPENAERVFDRFFKGADGHCGIGLSVARSSMEYMGGGIRAVSGQPGAVFEMTFPAAPQAQQDA